MVLFVLVSFISLLLGYATRPDCERNTEDYDEDTKQKSMVLLHDCTSAVNLTTSLLAVLTANIFLFSQNLHRSSHRWTLSLPISLLFFILDTLEKKVSNVTRKITMNTSQKNDESLRHSRSRWSHGRHDLARGSIFARRGIEERKEGRRRAANRVPVRGYISGSYTL